MNGLPKILTAEADINPDTSNQVSWQSAFWALVPIALNSMTQPSGKVLGMPSEYGFYFNSSPIVCTANALELFFMLVWRTYSMRSVNAAAQSMAEEVFEDVGGGRSGLAQLQENKAFRLIVFVIGALPQLIKLYAMRGILGTQFCASLFLGSFLIIEAVMMWLNTYRNTTQELDGQVTDLNDSKRPLLSLVLWTSYVFPFSLISTATWRKKVNSVLLCLFFIFMKALSLSRRQRSSSVTAPRDNVFRDIFRQVLLGIIFFFSVASLLYIGPLDIESLGRIVLWLILWTMAWTWFFIALKIGPAANAPPREHALNLGRFSPFFFILLQILAAIITYYLKYDPVGTYKPGWTNQLG